MLTTWFDRIGDHNPQLFREIKGRLTPRNAGVVAVLAIAGQLLIMLYFYSMLPFDGFPNAYCSIPPSEVYECARDAQGNIIILWQNWWTDIFHCLTWLTLLLMSLPGVYLLALDLDREERQGTLNFIRLSPESGRSILMGKMLGVPILADLAIALLIPLHVWACLQAGVSVVVLLSFYVLMQAGCFFLNSAAILGGFLSKFQPGAMRVQIGQGMALALVLLTLMFCLPGYVSWNVATSWHYFSEDLLGLGASTSSQGMQWFYFSLQNPALAHGFTLVNLALGSYWIWQAIVRCYQNPGYTLLSKTQSYGLVFYLQVLVLGFFFQDWELGNYYPTFFIEQLLVFFCLNTLLFLGLIVLLSNQRQALLDWSRFRHFERNQTVGTQGGRRHSLWRDLMTGEKSPANLAIALNLIIIGLLACLWVACWPKERQQDFALLGILLSLNMLAIYGAIAQLLLLMKDKRRIIWAFCGVVLTMGLPLALAAVYNRPNEALAMRYFLISPAPMVPMLYTSMQISMGTILQTMFAQWTVLALLNGRLTQQLRKLGESDSKALLTGKNVGAIGS